jgi:hypothetical protein
MKSALIIVGNIRTFENCCKSFETLISHFNCDIFISVSNSLLELHPYNKKVYNVKYECTLTKEMVYEKLNICKNFVENIKYMNFLEKNENDENICDNFVKKFDTKKKWVGSDIFNQYYKFKICLNAMEEYEKENNFKYNYIIKTRFDLLFNVETFPLYPLNNKFIYSDKNSLPNEINDVILITNDSNNFKILCDDLFKYFFNNPEKEYIYKSIHTFLQHIFSSNEFISSKIIESNVDRNYGCIFDTNITLVTCLYNINRERWKDYSRTMDKYFVNSEQLSLRPVYMINLLKCMISYEINDRQSIRNIMNELKKTSNIHITISQNINA